MTNKITRYAERAYGIQCDENGELVKYSEHLDALVEQTDEIALLRLEVIEKAKVIEDLRNQVKSLERMVDDLTAEF